MIDTDTSIHVCTVEDIVAEKLRALLQQELRNRYRCQDLLDLAVLVRSGAEFDPGRVAEFLERKSAARQIHISRVAYRSAELERRARVGYEALRQTSRNHFIPFDDAIAVLLRLIDLLPIPE